MATIASNVFLGTSATGANAASDEAKPNGSSGDFMKLVQGMIQGGTPGDQLPSNLLQLLLTGDSAGLDGVVDGALGDSADSKDDDVSDEAAAAAGLAALLAGLQTPVAGTAGSDSTGDSSLGAVGSQRGETLQALLGASQGMLAGALDGAAGTAGGVGADGTGPGAAGAAGIAGADGASAAAAAGVGKDATLLAAGTDPNALNGNVTGAAHLQNTLAAHRAADMAPQAASAEVRTPVGAQGWADEIGTHLAIMAANGREAASLRLSPEHLGPLEVQIQMKDGQANVVFGAQNPETRNALEQSLPRLREMFASQGLTLGNANVSRDAPRDSHKSSPFANGSRGSSDASSDISVKRVTMSRVGLVDTYV